MSNLVPIKVNDGSIVMVSDIKKEAILNVIENATKCSLIDKIVLFGSSLEERCNNNSDIDIALFGKKGVSKFFKSKGYKSFSRGVYTFQDFLHDYDILYFGKKDKVWEGVSNGKVIYRRV